MIFHRVAVWVRISDLASFHLCTMRQPYGGGEPWERLVLRLAAPPLPGLPWPFASRKSDPSQVPFLDHQRGAMGQPTPPFPLPQLISQRPGGFLSWSWSQKVPVSTVILGGNTFVGFS